MSPAAIVSSIREAGAEVQIIHGKVVVRGASRLPAALLEQARKYRGEVAEWLLDPAEAEYLAAERAAIIAESDEAEAEARPWK